MTPRVGWCGLDRKRLLLRGDEQRGCWEAGATVAPGTARPRAEALPATTRTFIPVAELVAPALTPVPSPAPTPAGASSASVTADADPTTVPGLPAILDALPPDRRGSTDGWTLFGEAEA